MFLGGWLFFHLLFATDCIFCFAFDIEQAFLRQTSHTIQHMVCYVFLYELDVQLSDIFLEKFHLASWGNEGSKMVSEISLTWSLACGRGTRNNFWSELQRNRALYISQCWVFTSTARHIQTTRSASWKNCSWSINYMHVAETEIIRMRIKVYATVQSSFEYWKSCSKNN
jgi:hypothetical protein